MTTTITLTIIVTNSSNHDHERNDHNNNLFMIILIDTVECCAAKSRTDDRYGSARVEHDSIQLRHIGLPAQRLLHMKQQQHVLQDDSCLIDTALVAAEPLPERFVGNPKQGRWEAPVHSMREENKKPGLPNESFGHMHARCGTEDSLRGEES